MRRKEGSGGKDMGAEKETDEKRWRERRITKEAKDQGKDKEDKGRKSALNKERKKNNKQK